MILILGKGDLAQALKSKLSDVELAGRPEFDFGIKNDCDKLVATYRPNIVINTVALNQDHDTWNIMSVNYVSMMYLTMAFYNIGSVKHIINISSTSTYWVSYPGITDGRLCYNLSKQAVSQFGREFNRKIVDQNSTTVSTIELGKFASKFNYDSTGGMSLEQAACTVISCVNNPVTNISKIR